jgi:hypothetical protein
VIVGIAAIAAFGVIGILVGRVALGLIRFVAVAIVLLAFLVLLTTNVGIGPILHIAGQALSVVGPVVAALARMLARAIDNAINGGGGGALQ